LKVKKLQKKLNILFCVYSIIYFYYIHNKLKKKKYIKPKEKYKKKKKMKASLINMRIFDMKMLFPRQPEIDTVR